MRVLQVHTAYREAGGEDAVVGAEAALLRAAGHEVATVTARNPTAPVATARTLATSPWNRASARQVAATARRRRPDVAHVHNTWYALSPAVLPALRSLGVPVVMTLHNYRITCANALLFRDGRPCTDCVGASPWHGVRHRCYRDSTVASAAVAATIALHRRRGTWDGDVDRFLALSEFARRQFLDAGLPPARVAVKPNFVADRGGRPLPPSRSATLLFVGRLSAEKGILRLLDAWQRLGRSPWELVVVGDGPLRAQVAARRLPGVRLLGSVPPARVADLMRSARALVFPSLCFENQPVTLLEAMAAGLPALVTDRGAAPETMADAGFSWDTDGDDDGAAFAQLADDAAVDAAGERGRARYEREFSPDVALRRLEAVYASVT